jgi:hypothetical protein
MKQGDWVLLLFVPMRLNLPDRDHMPSFPFDESLGLLTLTASIDNANWALVPATTVSETGTITLFAKSAWQITVSADRADGKMFPYDGSQYVQGGKSLQDFLSVAADGGVPVDLAAGGVLISGTGSTDPVTKKIFFSQPVTWNNAALPHGQTYNLGITFIISPVAP